MFDWNSNTFGVMLQVNVTASEGVQMSCDVLEYAERRSLFSFSGAMRFAASALRRISGRSRKLDLESTSNYMKKDLGFLDGRMPRCDDEMLR
ncbi:hypothetical protein [Sinorhizobium fredii]|uniref:hypothetical protein n=1 Tax=Rhizobium fredii TaxID=380 RepID=UPI003512AF02